MQATPQGVVPTPADIDQALAKLEEQAEGTRLRYWYGLGAARLDRADRQLAQGARGLKLVPLTTAMPKSKSSQSAIFLENRRRLFRIML